MSQRFERILRDRPHLPFILPILVFGLFLAGEQFWPQYKWLLYPLKTVATGACLLWLWSQFKHLCWRWSWWGVVIGVVVAVQWIGMEEFFKAYWHYPPLPMVGADIWQAQPFNPVEEFGGRNAAFWGWIMVRMAGAVIVVPFMEEIFWRGFLLRFFISRYFERVELGEFSWPSYLGVAGAFALMHPWYISAFVCGLIYNWLMCKTKSLSACVVAHAITNFLLWVYILRFDAWWLG